MPKLTLDLNMTSAETAVNDIKEVLDNFSTAKRAQMQQYRHKHLREIALAEASLLEYIRDLLP